MKKSDKSKVGDTTITFTPAQLDTVEKALEVYCRMRLGQFHTAFDTAFSDKIIGWNAREGIHKICRDLLTNVDGGPLFPMPLNGSYGVGCKEIGDGQIAYEVSQSITQYKAIKENDGYFSDKFSTRFNDPLMLSGEPEIEIAGFNKYVDIELSDDIALESSELFNDDKYEALWSLVKNNMKLPKSEKQEILEQEELDERGYLYRRYLVIRCHKAIKESNQ